MSNRLIGLVSFLHHEEYQNRRELQRDEGGSQTCKDLITAIKAAKNWKKRNDYINVTKTGGVWQKIDIYFRGNLYAVIAYNRLYIMVQDAQKTRSTKERLNRILMKFCGCQLYQKKGVWYIFNPQIGDVEYKYGMAIDLFI